MDLNIQSRLQGLGDIDLAILVSLIAEQHCIFSITSGPNSRLVDELRVACQQTFGLRPVVVQCSADISANTFNEELLVEEHIASNDIDIEQHDNNIQVQMFSVDRRPSKVRNLQHSQGLSSGQWNSSGYGLDHRRVSDIVIAVDMDLANFNVQVQVLELLRTKRIFTRTSMHGAPKDMLFIAVLSKPDAHLSHHLTDAFGMSHIHGEEDGFPHLEGETERHALPLFGLDSIRHLRDLTGQVRFTAEMAQYLHNVVIFMRTSRFVKGGVTGNATRQLHVICRALAPLHNIDYVPPSLVALAARKVYPHRLTLATWKNEKTLQWGSDPQAVRELLEGISVEDVIEDVLGSIETPL